MLKIEVVKFEAQDVITASVAAPDCICSSDTYTAHMLYGKGDHTYTDVNMSDVPKCPASSHPYCVPDDRHTGEVN